MKLLLALASVVLVVSACGNPGQGSLDSVGVLTPLDAVDEAGLVFTNGDAMIATLSLSDLEAIDIVRVELFEPFVEANSTFEGPTVEAVFASLGWGADGNVNMWAINDYAYEMAVVDLIDGDVVIATRENGAAIPIESGGPARIVFPDWSPSHDLEDTWVWSLGSFDRLD